MSATSKNKLFSKWRALIWPIYHYDLSKFLPLFFLAFFIGFNYTVLKNMKDALLVSTAGAGAEVIPFIKVWGIVPFYGFLSNKHNKRTVFFILVGFFSIFFILFSCVMYPCQEYLRLDALSDRLSLILPQGFKGLVAMIRYWSFSLFYVMSELWGSVVLSTLFWSLANEITSVSEASRYYALINTAINLAGLFAGLFSVWISTPIFLRFVVDEWHNIIILLTIFISISSIFVLFLYNFSYQKQNKKLIKEETFVKDSLISLKVNQKKEERERVKLPKLFSYISHSRYLLYIAALVLSYNLTIHLFEVVWKDQVSNLYPSPIDFNMYMGRVSSFTGIVSTLTSLLISGHLIRKFGWTLSAFLTPLIMFVTGSVFFITIFLFQKNSSMLSFLGMHSPLSCIVFLGSVQNILSRTSKFTFFDITKEMAFIPLSPEAKRRAKAVIDGVVSRVGKSGGSFLYQFLLILFSTISASINVVSFLLIFIFISWSLSIFGLSKKFSQLTIDENQSADVVNFNDKNVILSTYNTIEDLTPSSLKEITPVIK